MNHRRRLLIAFGAGSLSAVLPALAQQEKRARRIGYYSGGSIRSNAAWLAAFREGMAELRWIEGRDYAIESRYTNGDTQAGPRLAAELIAMRPDLLLTPADSGARLLIQGTTTIPIVFANGQYPLGNGLAASLQRPGGIATGLTSLAGDLGAKRLQLLKEALPRVVHIVLLFDPGDVGSLSQVKETEGAAARLGIRVTPIRLGQAADIEPAFKHGAHAYTVAQGFFINTRSQEIVDRILRSKVPAIFERVDYVEAGGLMSYGPSPRDNFRRAAGYVDKILKGAKPADLPIEQPVKFELVLNQKNARAMGIEFPQSIILQADRVIE